MKYSFPGCGVPVCGIVDMRIKTFKSMCHLVDWMQVEGKYRQFQEVQRGTCENASNVSFQFFVFNHH